VVPIEVGAQRGSEPHVVVGLEAHAGGEEQIDLWAEARHGGGPRFAHDRPEPRVWLAHDAA
jgi:hypothetical protein